MGKPLEGGNRNPTMKPIFILLLAISLQAENIICLNAIDDMILAIESNDKTKGYTIN